MVVYMKIFLNTFDACWGHGNVLHIRNDPVHDIMSKLENNHIFSFVIVFSFTVHLRQDKT